MKQRDDSSLSPDQYRNVRREAEQILQKASAIGRFPTPLSDIMDAAKVILAPEDIFDETFIQKMRRKAGDTLKRALSKVMGLFDSKARVIFIDGSVHKNKLPFLKIHETGHGVLPWQQSIYTIIEDCKQSLSPEISDLFDREANVFASEVLFQLDKFKEEAAQHKLALRTPLRLSKKYGTSIYASIRRYVSGHHRTCAVLVLNPPEIIQEIGFRAELRRVVVSPTFQNIFGNLNWPEFFTPNDPLGLAVPIGQVRMSSPRTIVLTDRNGERWECVVEGFTQTYQVFILIHAVKSLVATTVHV